MFNLQKHSDPESSLIISVTIFPFNSSTVVFLNSSFDFATETFIFLLLGLYVKSKK